MANGTHAGLTAAADATKQIITLCSAFLTFGVTFAAAFKPADARLTVPSGLKLSWLLLAVSIVCGVWTLLAITGTQQQSGGGNAMGWNIRIPAIGMVLAFLVAMGCMAWAGWSITR